METFTPKQEKRGGYEKFKKVLLSGRNFMTGLAFMRVLAPGEMQAQSTSENSLSTQDSLQTEQTSNNLVAKHEQEIDGDKSRTIHLDQTSILKDSGGEGYYNPWSIIAPVQVSIEKEKQIEGDIEMYIPYRWARNFDEAKAMNEEERQAIVEYIKEELRKEIAQSVYYLVPVQWSRDAYNKNNDSVPDFSGLNLKSIKITGLASPEGEGVESILGREEKNEKLGKLRAENMDPLIREALAELGLDPSIVEITGEEAEFSDTELTALEKMGHEHGFGKYAWDMGEDTLDVQAIYELIRVYNTAKESLSAEDIASLDEIVGAKRNVRLELDIEGEEKHVVVFPLPLLLLLLLKRPRTAIGNGMKMLGKKSKEEADRLLDLYKAYKEKPIEVPEPEPETYPRQIFSEATEHEANLQNENPNFHDLVRDIQSGKTEMSYEQLRDIDTLVLKDEIGRYYGEVVEESRYGLNYHEIVRDTEKLINKRMPKYNWEEEITEKVAENLLDAWQMYDRNVRRGIKTVDGQPLPVETNLEYRHDVAKVAWALAGARHIVDLIKQSKVLASLIYPDTSTRPEEIPDAVIEEVLIDKIVRTGGNMSKRGNSTTR